MREIRTYGSEGGGAARSPYPYQAFRADPWIPAFAVMTESLLSKSSDFSIFPPAAILIG